MRAHWPERYPLAFRLSVTDWIEGGLEVEDVIDTAKALEVEGVDMIDCSSCGIGGKERPRRMKLDQGFQVLFLGRIRRDAGIATMAVGFLWCAEVCERILADGEADMVTLARELLDDPNWAFHAAEVLAADPDHGLCPIEAGWWLMKRDRLAKKLGLR